MTEKQASSEIAQSRERFEKWFRTTEFRFDGPIGTYEDVARLTWEQAERDTRELCAQIVEMSRLDTSRESEHEKLENFADRVAERIRGKE
jgi:hypothetical protein